MKIDDLRIICQSEKLNQNKGLTLFNRKISIYFTRIFIFFKISANCVSVAGIVLGIIGSLFFIPGSLWWNAYGVTLLYFSLICDQVDGELARYYKTVNLGGVYIDEIRHLIIYAITVFCLSFPASYITESKMTFLFGFIGAMTLTISRIEERLPYQIFTEKFILRRNYSGGIIAPKFDRNYSANPANKNNPNDTLRQEWARKIMATVFYLPFQYLFHQVWIIIWLLLVTVIDQLILPPLKLPKLVNTQLLLFFLFTCYGPLVLIKTIHGHFTDGRTEKINHDLAQRVKKIFREKHETM